MTDSKSAHRAPWLTGLAFIAAAALVMSLAPTPGNSRNFNPRLVATLPSQDDDDLPSVISCCCGCNTHAPLDSPPPLFVVNTPDELKALTPVSTPPSPPEPPIPPRIERRLPTARERRQNLPPEKRNSPIGPSEASERAVDNALAWLAAHQRPDGSWSFDHGDGPCNGRCRGAGTLKEATNAATGLALLAFLAAGESHVRGRHQHVVDRGLRYLVAAQQPLGISGSWKENVGQSEIYSHAIATTAITDALMIARETSPSVLPSKPTYEMTDEQRRQWRQEVDHAKRRPAETISIDQLTSAAQAGVDYLADRRCPSGGWSVANDGEANTVATGWALLALKSGFSAPVRISKTAVIDASKFFDAVADGEHQATYQLTTDRSLPRDELRTPTAIAWYCRMYLGWDRLHPGMQQGAEQIARWQPSTGDNANMEYNWFATQVLFHYGDEAWPTWNPQMRDFLVESQATIGHERGSWSFPNAPKAQAGGRLHATTLAALTLETYYRYPRIYAPRLRPRDVKMCGVGAIP